MLSSLEPVPVKVFNPVKTDLENEPAGALRHTSRKLTARTATPVVNIPRATSPHQSNVPCSIETKEDPYCY